MERKGTTPIDQENEGMRANLPRSSLVPRRDDNAPITIPISLLHVRTNLLGMERASPGPFNKYNKEKGKTTQVDKEKI